MIGYLSIFLFAIVVSLLLTAPWLWLLRFFRLGQPIREEGPAAHYSKSGTPTMGGVGFLAASIILVIILIDLELHPEFLALLLLMVGFALIGLTDDLLKVFRGKNQGLTFWQKIFWQIFVAALFALYLTSAGYNLTLGPLLAIFLVVGAANATNLTDGLNGLLAGTGTIAFLAFFIISQKLLSANSSVFALIVAGTLLAFLYYNFPRARLFMGDVGSLALGAALAGLTLILHKELRLAIIGGIFVVEALSVIIQVFGYKLFKKRLFRMAPLHHHLELLGLSEKRVVIVFWLVALLFALVGVII